MQPNSRKPAVAATTSARGSALSSAAAQRAPSAEHAELLAQLHAISAQLGILTDREAERAAHREAVIDRLHAENQALRRRELDLMLDPVRNGLYRLHDLARREAYRWAAANAPAAEHAVPLLTLIADEIGEVLARTGVEPYTVRPGEPYDPTRHRPVDAEDVADAASDGTVLRALSSGFTCGERVTRRADVVVGQLSGRIRSQAESESR